MASWLVRRIPDRAVWVQALSQHDPVDNSAVVKKDHPR